MVRQLLYPSHRDKTLAWLTSFLLMVARSKRASRYTSAKLEIWSRMFLTSLEVQEGQVFEF